MKPKPPRFKNLPFQEYPHGLTVAELQALSDEHVKLLDWCKRVRHRRIWIAGDTIFEFPNNRSRCQQIPDGETPSLKRIQDILDVRNARHPELRPFTFHYTPQRTHCVVRVYPTNRMIDLGVYVAPAGVAIRILPKINGDDFEI